MRADRIHQIRDHLAGSRVLVVSFDHPIDRCRYLLSTFGDAVNERWRRKTHRTGDRAPMNQLRTLAFTNRARSDIEFAEWRARMVATSGRSVLPRWRSLFQSAAR